MRGFVDRLGALVGSQIDAQWLFSGVEFYILLFAIGRCQRLVPTSWNVFQSLSTLVQYCR